MTDMDNLPENHVVEVPIGPELDALVAEHVMEYHRIPGFKFDRLGPIENPNDILLPKSMNLTHAMTLYTLAKGAVSLTHMVPRYSTTLEHGWSVLEAMRKRGYAFNIRETLPGHGTYIASFYDVNDKGCFGSGRGVEEAICRAALNTIDRTILILAQRSAESVADQNY